jgi:ParB family chromosome partitioning protein
MGKLEELSRLTAGNVQDSLGIGRPARPAEAPAPATAPSAPARWQGVTKSKNAVEIPVERIVADPGQPREEFDEEALGRLAESLRTRGQLQPIRVRWDEGSERYMILVGERRWRGERTGTQLGGANGTSERGRS